jgi:signal transduction histidine kinase
VTTLVGSLIQPTGNINTVVVETNRLIAVLTQWLIAMLVRLQQQHVDDMQAKAEYQHRFVDILSHEIGNALTTVDGQALRLMKLSEQLAPSDLRLRAGKIRTAVDRIQAIIDRVQFASSLSDGSIPIAHRSVNLHAMMQEVIEQMTEDRRTASIELILCPEPQVVSGDEMLLRQVFENIIMNSVKYSPRDAPISVSVTKRGDVSRITIADRGSGIPRHELPQVRRPYYRGENSKGTAGAGLGLYLVERIVEAHKGRLFIESEVGKGTQVIVDIPRSKDVVAT